MSRFPRGDRPFGTRWDMAVHEAPLWGLPKTIDGLWRWEAEHLNPHDPRFVVSIDVQPSERFSNSGLKWFQLRTVGGLATHRAPATLARFIEVCGWYGIDFTRGAWTYYGPGSTQEQWPYQPPGACVYVVQGENGGAVKIGYSSSLNRRIWELQPTSPDKLLIICWRELPNEEHARKEEQRWHTALAADRLEGEWFRPSGLLLARIGRMASSRTADVIRAAERARLQREASRAAHLGIMPQPASRAEAQPTPAVGSAAPEAA